MPITIKPSPQKVGNNTDKLATSSADLLLKASYAWGETEPDLEFERLMKKKYDIQDPSAPDTPINDEPETKPFIGRRPILHCSFSDRNPHTDFQIHPYGNGFLHAITRAYQQDLHLVLRPDDVWLSIVTQFSFHVNAHAEALRTQFVAHEGKKELILRVDGTFAELDVGKMARKFTCLMEEHLVDKEIRDWIVPSFSTTTDHDVAIASMAMMATMKKYFDFTAMSCCGFPSVTLLGEVGDWRDMVRRVARLEKYGSEPAEWAKLLTPVLEYFVRTFETPDSVDVRNFWLEACYAERSYGSGQEDTFSGWITAFAFWDVDGAKNKADAWTSEDKTVYVLEGQEYPIITQGSIPPGVVQVPIRFVAFELGIQFETTLVAGSVGAESIVQEGKAKEETSRTGLQPKSGWWMLEDSRGAIEDKYQW